MHSNSVPIRSSCGLTIGRTSELLEPGELDYVVVVGGLLHGQVALDEANDEYLRRIASSRGTIIGLCTGSFILCRLGLMNGRRVCVSWYHHQDFRETFPEIRPVCDQLYLVDGNRITCAGGTGVADLAAKLVERHIGFATAQKALHILLIDRARSDTSAQPAPPMTINVTDDRIARALLRMEQHLAVPPRISRLASEIGMSERNLERLFRCRLGETPHASYLRIRLRHARWMLEKTDLSQASIASELGFVDSSI